MLEAGHVLHLPRLAADIREEERRFLHAGWLDARSKNISVEDDAARIRGMVGTEEEQEGLRKLVVRDRGCVVNLSRSWVRGASHRGIRFGVARQGVRVAAPQALAYARGRVAPTSGPRSDIMRP